MTRIFSDDLLHRINIDIFSSDFQKAKLEGINLSGVLRGLLRTHLNTGVLDDSDSEINVLKTKIDALSSELEAKKAELLNTQKEIDRIKKQKTTRVVEQRKKALIEEQNIDEEIKEAIEKQRFMREHRELFVKEE